MGAAWPFGVRFASGDPPRTYVRSWWALRPHADRFVTMTAEPALEGTAAGLLERDAELAEQRRLLDGALAGTGGLLVIEGPAGAGKTELLEAARAEAVRRRMTVLTARGG